MFTNHDIIVVQDINPDRKGDKMEKRVKKTPEQRVQEALDQIKELAGIKDGK